MIKTIKVYFTKSRRAIFISNFDLAVRRDFHLDNPPETGYNRGSGETASEIVRK
jgi:hypothetical protein